MSEKGNIVRIENILANSLGKPYVRSMLKHMTEMNNAYLINDWEKSCVKAGKFVEALLKGIHYHTTGKKLKTIKVGSEIDRLTNLPKGSFGTSIRLLIPRFCRSIYHVASDRGARHDLTGFDPNKMDGEVTLSCVFYILAELVRIFHPGSLSVAEAQRLANSLVQKKIPLIAEAFNLRRVLLPRLKCRDQVLLFLYDSHPLPISIDNLLKWTEYTNITNFQKKVIMPLHKQRFLEYQNDQCVLLPPAIGHVEQLLSDISQSK